MAKIFTPLNVGALELAHRLVTLLGPDQGERGGIRPTRSAEEYADRTTDGGLIVTEPCRVSVQGTGAPGHRGLDSTDIAEWRLVTEAVHDRGGWVVAQLSHAGHIAHTSLNREGPVGASSIRSAEKVLSADGSWLDAETPRALDQEEIDAIVEDYRQASRAAREARFDGVEITATTESLPGQFLLETTNAREDDYGGTIDNRITFLAQVVEAVSDVWTPSRVGVRLSPWASLHDSGTADLFGRVLPSLADQEIAWVNIVRLDANTPIDTAPDSENCRLARHFRAAFPGVMLFSGGFTLSTAHDVVERRVADAVGLYESAVHPHFVRQTLEAYRAGDRGAI